MSNLYPFEKATPESLGIKSENILRFLDELKEQRINMHGFMIVRHGKVAAEGYWKPFTEDTLHRMYSCSKSFTSTGIGLLVGDGKISLDDPVLKFYPEYDTPDLHPFKRTMTVRNLLMMATPYEGGTYDFCDPDWVETFFKKCEPTHPGGTIWHYDTSGTHMLSAIVERVSGKKLTEFLYERIFSKMGGSEDMWCLQEPSGKVSWGGSGVIARQRDLARLAYLWINLGRFNGEQLIPESYIREGSSRQIDNTLLGMNNRNHRRGYGYQVWMEPYGGFSFWGLATQYAVCFRDEDLMLITTADTLVEPIDEEYVFNDFARDILKTLSDEPLPENPAAQAELTERLNGLELILPVGETSSPWVEKINNRVYKLNPNRMDLTEVSFRFAPDGKTGILHYENATGPKEIEFGLGFYQPGRFPQKGIAYDVINRPSDHLFGSLNTAVWTEPHKLEVSAFIEEIHCALVTMKFSFYDDGDGVALMWCKIGENMLNEYYGNTCGRAD